MTACILILTLSGECAMDDGKCLCVEPGELTATLVERPDMWERLRDAVEEAKEKAK